MAIDLGKVTAEHFVQERKRPEEQAPRSQAGSRHFAVAERQQFASRWDRAIRWLNRAKGKAGHGEVHKAKG